MYPQSNSPVAPSSNACTQLSRQIFDAAVAWAMKADKTSFWKGHRRTSTKVESPRESVISIRKSGSVISRNKSEEFVSSIDLLASLLIHCCRDEAQLSKLQQLGMTSTEEAKLVAMKDYILKLARAISRLENKHQVLCSGKLTNMT